MSTGLALFGVVTGRRGTGASTADGMSRSIEGPFGAHGASVGAAQTAHAHLLSRLPRTAGTVKVATATAINNMERVRNYKFPTAMTFFAMNTYLQITLAAIFFSSSIASPPYNNMPVS